jgi:hypothetical protein
MTVVLYWDLPVELEALLRLVEAMNGTILNAAK